MTLLAVRFNTSYGQHQFNYFRHISTSEGFALNSVNSIDQDDKGFIWFGTRNGLMRYDGVNLKLMHHENEEVKGQGINDIYTIYKDKGVGIWIGSKRGLRVYDQINDSLARLQLPDKIINPSRRVFDILKANKDEFFLATDAGVVVYNTKTGKIVGNRLEKDNPTSLSSKKVTSLYKSEDGTIWVGTHNGVNKLVVNKKGRLKFKRYLYKRKNDILVNAIINDHNGNVWLGTSYGLFVMRKGQKNFERFAKLTGQKLTNNAVRCLTVDHKGRIWVGTYDGLNIIDKELNVIAKINHSPQNTSGLTGNNIRSLFTDNNGGVWISTYFGGVNYWSDQLMGFEKFDERHGTQLGYNVVNAIVEGANEKIYFGTEGGGLTIYDSKNQIFSKLDELEYGNPIGGVKTLLNDGNDKVWLGTFDKGLVHLNLKTKKYKEFRHNVADPNTIASDKIHSMQRAIDGRFWVGTINRGLNFFDPQKNTFKLFHARDKKPAIKYNNVRSLLVSKSGDLYVGTGLGISKLPVENYLKGNLDFHFFKMENGEEVKFYVNDIIETKDGKVWVGAQILGGLFYLKDDKVLSVNLKDVTSVFSLVEDPNDGKLWLSTEKGIVSYDPLTGEQKTFNSDNGVAKNEFNRGARLRASDGRIYFGGASGVTSFHPSSLGKKNTYAPKVVLTDINLLGKELSPGDASGILEKSIEYTDEITLDYDQHIFTLSFSMPNYVFPDNKEYSYRLLGLDDAWVKTTNDNVSYAIQKGGEYIFEVKGYNSHGIESKEVTRLKVNIKDAPWLTTWAYTFYALVVLGIFGLITYFFRSRIFLEHQLEMETQALSHQQEIHQQKLRFFTNISHEFRTPLTLISGPLEKLITDYKGPSSVYKQLLVIKQNTDQLFKLINELMDFRKLENNQVQLKAAKGNIVKFIKEIYLSFSQQAKIRSIDYTFTSEEEEVNAYYDRDQLEKVLYNLISNAFKYTSPKGAIGIAVAVQNEKVTIGIKDSGIGIEANHLEKIFDRFYMASQDGNRKKKRNGSGIGLAIVKDIVDLHRGEIRVESEKGKGSHFIITLQLGHEHLNSDEIIENFKDSEDISQYYESEEYLEEVKNATIELEEDVESEEKEATILVVEDNSDISSFIHNILASRYKVHVAENGALGFQQALSIQPDLIISDVMMPVMDGIEMCSKIKSDDRTSHIPVMLLTARTSLIYKINALESGAEDYLSKPFEVKELLLKCKNMINTHHSLKKKYADNGATMDVEEVVDSVDQTLMNNAIKIIKDNVENQFLNINFLCEELGISRSLLFTKFKNWTDQTPNEYILNVRMKKAATLIEQGKVNISEVGYKVGFKSANYFSKSFKKHYGMSPKEYAAKFKESLGIED
ncbi:two-component regulator propeller domain-containing protein [Flammeovirga sp. OC4]|uniref:two-component regulator propeller domain-containing protein n=1 Tax=Flammeovirga sp. OC4 TaxID=1382345 RepID=UPI00155D9A34|nr:two-component regulator propeller domain-containing protein [Flammeovirga sp. OC4]